MMPIIYIGKPIYGSYFKTKSEASVFMLVGAIIFMVSNSVLAINKFYNQKYIFQIIVMVTYILAQYLIYKSMVSKSNKIRDIS